MGNMPEIKIDKENMCIDRNSEFGKQLDAFNKKAAASTDPNEKAFLTQLSAYAEAALVVDGVLPADEAAAKLAILKQQMEQSISSVK